MGFHPAILYFLILPLVIVVIVVGIANWSTNGAVDGDSDKDYCLEREWWDCKDAGINNQCGNNEYCDAGAKNCKTLKANCASCGGINSFV